MSTAIIVKNRDKKYIARLLKSAIGSREKVYNFKMHADKLYTQEKQNVDFRAYGVHCEVKFENGDVLVHWYKTKNQSFWTPDIKTWDEGDTRYNTLDDACDAMAEVIAEKKLIWVDCYTENLLHYNVFEVLC